MKKALSLILALVVCLSLCACGGGNDTPESTGHVVVTTEGTEASTSPPETEPPKPTKDDLLENAVPLMNADARSAFENPAYAKGMVGNTYIIYGKIVNIEFDYVVLQISAKDEAGKSYSYDWLNLQVQAYLPNEEISEVSNDDYITIVGEITGVEKLETFMDVYGGLPIEGTAIIIENAYCVEKELYNS